MSPTAGHPAPGTLPELLAARAQRFGDRLAFRYSRDGEEEQTTTVTFRELDMRARRIAASLQQQGTAGERVLVLCPPGLDFIAGLFGCLYAGAIAVPVHPPLRDHLVPRVAAIIADVAPRFALTTAELQPRIRAAIDGLGAGPVDGAPLHWCVTDAVGGDVTDDITDDVGNGTENWAGPAIAPEAVAMVQYTSGSTSDPKGVMLTHANLLHNLEAIRDTWDGDESAEAVFWLPPFHDMGLIGGILGALHAGATATLMSPTAFIKRPMRWLEAISRHRATITAAPNFAYDMCVELSTPEQRAALDLSNWRVAMCGAEPVRTATLASFAEAFAPAGFSARAYYPVYGLAEGTLLVSGGSASPEPIVCHIDRAALGENRVVEVDAAAPEATALVGCGIPQGGQRVAIVDPDTGLECEPDGVGEIWVSGPSVAVGYWGRPEQSAETFAATIADTGEGPFLRTGDLGFLHSGELFITGRSKDLIIIRGTNHYPNDIELTVQDCDPALLRGRGAVFAVPGSGGDEQLVIVQEVDPSRFDEAGLAALLQQIRTAVTARHEIRVHAVVLAQPLQLPTTSSGKIQRTASRQRYLDDELPVVTAWTAGGAKAAGAREVAAAGAAAAVAPVAPGAATESGTPTRSAADVTAWLIERLAADLEIPTAEIIATEPFAYYGLDSVHAIRLATALEEWLGLDLPPTLAYEYPTIDALARYLVGETADAQDEPAGERIADEPIAIVGIGCRFPGADGPAAFWRLLTDGTDAISTVPADRWDADAFYNADPAVPGTAVTRAGGFLREIDRFDNAFFTISPREAAQMDPQQRLLLEVAWEALEDAGQVPEQLAGSNTGVFVGIATNDYGYLQLGQPQLVDAYTGTGNALSIAANRLSYTFDFHGPSLAVDTACSSSLVATDLACRSLRDGECDLALVGGVNVILSPALSINFTKARVMAADGHCKTFDADADGYVRGEGAGVVVLKPLSRALADNDPVYAVIRGTATNSDGRTNGLIAPSGRAQEAVLAEAYRRAGVSPGAVQYVEAHGTGTALGDAIEARALGTVLADGRPPGSRCLTGSVKTNIGHLEAAAGVAGLIKTALALQHRQIPASLNFTAPNPHIPFESLPLDVARTLTPWPQTGGRAVAGVSSFGFGGTNAHVVLTEAPQARSAAAPTDTGRPELLALSARSPEALAALVGEYEMELVTGAPLGDLCYTAGARRGHHDYRLALVGDSQAAMFESLAAYRQNETHPGLAVGHCRPGSPPAVTFVFSGQGSQWLGMGRRLRAEEPAFAEALAACDAALQPHLGRSITDEIDGATTDSGAAADVTLNDIGYIQPAIFAVQVALAALWRSWGVQPAAVVGHSLGEVAAAHVAGALSLDDAARVIATRAGLLRRVRGHGTMLLTELTETEAAELIAGRESQVSIAALNGRRSTVLSGDQAVLTDIVGVLEQRDRFCRFIDVDVASHSPQMDVLAADLRAALTGLTPNTPAVPFYSTVTGEQIADRPLDADYWVTNLCSPVRFSPTLRSLLAAGSNTFIEISPHPILLVGIGEDATDLGVDATLLASLRRPAGPDQDPGRATPLAALGTLYTLGQPVTWAQLYPVDSHCIPAPRYPWQRVRAWVDTTGPATPVPAVTGGSAERLPWQGPLRSAADPQTVLAQVQIGTALLPGLADHRVGDTVVVPAALLLRLALVGLTKAFGDRQRSVRDIVFHQPLELPDDAPRTVQVVLRGEPAEVTFECYAADGAIPPGESFTPLVSGVVVAATGIEAPAGAIDDITARCLTEISGPDFYLGLADHGLHLGPGLQAITVVRRRDGEALATLTPTATGAAGTSVDDLDAAVVVDACVRTLAATLPDSAGAFLPVGVAEIQKNGTLADVAFCHAVRSADTPDSTPDSTPAGTPATVTGDVFLLRADGAVVFAAQGLRLRRVRAAAPAIPADLRDRLFTVQWQPTSVAADSTATEPSTAGTWLIFTDTGTVADTLRDHLDTHGQSCVLVEPTAGLTEVEQVSPEHYRIDPARRDHYDALLRHAFGEHRPPCRGVAHLWNLRTGHPAPQAPEQSMMLGTLSVALLVQAISAAGWPAAPRLWLVTRGAQVTDPDAGTVVVPAQAPVWGLARSIDHEHPELRVTAVDLSVGGGPEEPRALFQEMWSDTPEVDVALHGHRRYVARLTPYTDTADKRLDLDRTGEGVEIRSDATYLITGGLGALGLVLARWLVDQGARHLALLGRRAPSAETESALDALRTAGAQVAVLRGDVADAAELGAALGELAALPPLRGVIHAAGVVDDAIIDRLDEARLRTVLAPKVAGSWNLYEATRDADLEFFVMFSSAASVLGSPGAANYSAANAFCDALAWYCRADGRPALSINWGPWADLGFYTRSELHGHFTAYGVTAMSATDSLRALATLLARPATQVAVLDIDWSQWRPGARPPLLTAVRGAGAAPAAPLGGGLRAELVGATAEQRRTLVESYLRDLLAAKLGLVPSRLDMHAPLTTLGVDSLITLELRIQVERELGVVVPIARLLDGPSVTALADWLSTQSAEVNTGDQAQPDARNIPAAQGAPPTDDSQAAAAAAEVDLLARVGELSDDDVDELLRKVVATGDRERGKK